MVLGKFELAIVACGLSWSHNQMLAGVQSSHGSSGLNLPDDSSPWLETGNLAQLLTEIPTSGFCPMIFSDSQTSYNVLGFLQRNIQTVRIASPLMGYSELKFHHFRCILLVIITKVELLRLTWIQGEVNRDLTYQWQKCQKFWQHSWKTPHIY